MSSAHFDGPLRNREPETAAGARVAAPVAARLGAAIEPVEDARRRFGRDARTGVDDVDGRTVRRFRDADADLSAFRRVLDRVVDEVDQRLPRSEERRVVKDWG